MHFLTTRSGGRECSCGLPASTDCTSDARLLQISVVAYNEDASAEPTDLRFSQESDKSELVALGRPGG